MYRAILAAGLQPGQTLLLVGAEGGLDHLGIQCALAMGLSVIATDVQDAAIALCREMGADVVIDARAGKENVSKEI